MFRSTAVLLMTIGAVACAAPATAAVMGVKTIHVTSARAISDPSDSYIQIAELIATQAGTGVDVALASNGGTATGSSVWGGGATPDHAIDGVYPAAYPNLYHSNTGAGEFLDVTLAAPDNLSALTIYGRTDCCNERDMYDIAFFDSLGNQIGGTYSLDNSALGGGAGTLNFGPVSGAPEPAAWAATILGLFSVGAILRRRRRSTPALAA